MKGFTLIELVVVIAITALVMAGVIANYSRYLSNQTVKQTAISLKTNLQLAYTKAVNGEKPIDESCSSVDGQLNGYQVDIQTTGYTMQAVCEDDGVVLKVGPVTAVTVPKGITITSNNTSVLFQVINRGVTLSADPAIFTIVGRNSSYTIELTAQGQITDIGFK